MYTTKGVAISKHASQFKVIIFKQSGTDGRGTLDFSSEVSLIVHYVTVAFGSWLLGLSGSETLPLSDEQWEEGEPRIFWNYGYKNICKKKCCYKCCEVNKIICLLQGGPTEFLK